MNRSPDAAVAANVGDVVLCPDARYRADLKIPGELGLVLETTKERARVHFPTAGGEPWIAVEHLARAKDPDAAGVPSWMARACFLARTLEAIRIEIAQRDAETCALKIFHGEVDLARLDRIRSELGDTLRWFTLSPAGLHKIEAAVAFAPARTATPASSASPSAPR
jgi:hypothetical protein